MIQGPAVRQPVLFLFVLVWALARIIPRLGTVARALAGVYLGRLRGLVAPAPDTR